MKYALLKYKSYAGIFNIGDYIQSLAASQFLPTVDELICREELDTYKGDSIKLVMNGWFLHEIEHWPPSVNIIPLFVAFHINFVAYDLLESQSTIEYFRKHEPIGCRDYETMERLKKKGINAYFSGCLTLTLANSFKNNFKGNNVYIVDPPLEFSKSIRNVTLYFATLLFNLKKVTRLVSKLYDKRTFEFAIKTAAYYYHYSELFDDEILLNAIYIKHNVSENQFQSEKDKFKYAKNLLKLYSEAKLVITSRIHCALPCLAMETPVLFLDNSNKVISSACRLHGLLEFFNIINYNYGKLEPVNLKIKKIKHGIEIRNSDNFKKYKELLINKCTSFLSE